MNLAREMAVGVVGILLIWSLGTSVVLGTLQLTVLDAEFVTNSIEEEGGYELVVDRVSELEQQGELGLINERVLGTANGSQSANGTNASADLNATEGVIDVERTLQDSLTEEYLRTETERNLHRLYTYLHGESSALNLSLNVAPVKENFSDSVSTQVRSADIGTRMADANPALVGGADPDDVERLTPNATSYQAARADFRADVRDRVLNRSVEQGFSARNQTESGRDQLLDLVVDGYDPSAYTAEEKTEMVADNETAIRAALRDRIETEQGTAIDQAVDDELANLTASYRPGNINLTGASDLRRAVVHMQYTVVSGLAGDTDYDSFVQQYEDRRAWIALEVTAHVETRLDQEFSNRIDLNEHLGRDARMQIDQARYMVEWLDLAAVLMPGVVAALIVLLLMFTGSVTAVTKTLGMGMIWAGLPTYIGTRYAESRLEALFSWLLPQSQEVADLFVALITRVVDVLGLLALLMGVGGLVVVGFLYFVSSTLEEQVEETIEEQVEEQLQEIIDK